MPGLTRMLGRPKGTRARIPTPVTPTSRAMIPGGDSSSGSGSARTSAIAARPAGGASRATPSIAKAAGAAPGASRLSSTT